MRALCVAALLLVACVGSEGVDVAKPALYSCNSREVIVSPTDPRVRYTWCERDRSVCSATPDVDVCGDREGCEVECVLVADACR